MDRVQIVSISLVVLLLGVIFQLIRKNRLLEQYSLLWILSAAILLLISLWKGLLDLISSLAGIYYPPSALFLFAILCGIMIALHFSVVISRLTKQNHTLAQEIALLKQKIEIIGKSKDFKCEE
ncbi:DUF2304 domain-containing protein [bacterium]|nr:DUF2304 domain-containing protein [bacterium]